MTPLLAAERIGCAYEDEPVFSDVSLAIRRGQFAGIVGPSGSGKTTLLKAFLGIVPLSKGRILFEGGPVNWGPQRPSLWGSNGTPPSVGYVPQIQTVDWNFPVTVEQVVLMGLYRSGSRAPWPTAKERGRVSELLERLEIGGYARRHIKALSGGEQQRVFLARALAGDPLLVLLDEPTAGVDLKTQHGVLHLLGELNRAGLTILLTTHDLNSVARHLPWVICFNHGVVAQGDPEEVFTSSTLSRTYESEMVVVRRDGMTLIVDSPEGGYHFAREGSG